MGGDIYPVMTSGVRAPSQIAVLFGNVNVCSCLYDFSSYLHGSFQKFGSACCQLIYIRFCATTYPTNNG